MWPHSTQVGFIVGGVLWIVTGRRVATDKADGLQSVIPHHRFDGDFRVSLASRDLKEVKAATIGQRLIHC